jgi:hypothetical protein
LIVRIDDDDDDDGTSGATDGQQIRRKLVVAAEIRGQPVVERSPSLWSAVNSTVQCEWWTKSQLDEEKEAEAGAAGVGAKRGAKGEREGGKGRQRLYSEGVILPDSTAACGVTEGQNYEAAIIECEVPAGVLTGETGANSKGVSFDFAPLHVAVRLSPAEAKAQSRPKNRMRKRPRPKATASAPRESVEVVVDARRGDVRQRMYR